MTANSIRLVIFDWAGTTVDHGCFAPVIACVEAFRSQGIEVTTAQAREPMGLQKRDHLQAVFKMPAIAKAWRERFGTEWTEADLDRIYHTFLPLQATEAVRCSTLIPGVLEALVALRASGLRFGATTGYPRAIGEAVAAKAAEEGYRPDHAVFPDDVAGGRPAPWMIFRNMEALGVYPPATVVKVGDTIPDIAEGRNAGVWSIGLSETGSELGLTAGQVRELPAAELEQRRAAVATKLTAAGAHAVIRSVAELPGLIDDLQRRIALGERP